MIVPPPARTAPPARQVRSAGVTRIAKAALITLTGVGIASTLAACSGAAEADGTSGSSNAASSPSANVVYKDGSYSERGTYASPGGAELINVALTIKGNIVTAVTVKTIRADPTATQYEGMFEAGIAEVVIGKNINSLNVTRVAGSSLTSMGFDNAMAKIKADALK